MIVHLLIGVALGVAWGTFRGTPAATIMFCLGWFGARAVIELIVRATR